MYPEQRLERGGRVSEKWQTNSRAHQSQLSCDRTHLQTRTLWCATILAILKVEWLYHSQLRATVGSKTSGSKSVAVSRYYHRCKCVWLLCWNSPQNLHSVPNWNFVYACVDLAIYCIGRSGRFFLGRPVYPEQRLERGGRVSEKWQTNSRAHQSQLSCDRTHLRTRTLWCATILAILEVEWLYHSQLRATVCSKTSGRNAGSVEVSRHYHRCKCIAIMPQNLHSVPNWNFVYACVDLAGHCTGRYRKWPLLAWGARVSRAKA